MKSFWDYCHFLSLITGSAIVLANIDKVRKCWQQNKSFDECKQEIDNLNDNSRTLKIVIDKTITVTYCDEEEGLYFSVQDWTVNYKQSIDFVSRMVAEKVNPHAKI